METKEAVKKAIETYPEHVKKYHDGYTGTLGLFVGEAMKLTRGHADPKELTRLVKEALEIKKGTL